eukprot:s70_g7.t1
MAADFPVPLERAAAPLLLRFNASGAGRAEAEYGEEDPPAKRCLSRLLREDATSKRPRMADAADEEERLRLLREAQEAALEGARKTTQVATLLGIPWGEQQVRFLKLHPVVPKKIDLEEILKTCFASSEASEERRQELLEVAGKRLTDAVSQQHTQMEEAVLFLGHRWPLLSSAGQCAVEVAPAEWIRDLLPRALVQVANNPKRGVCLSFPTEMSRLIQPRRELFLTFSSKNLGAGGAGSSHGSQQVPASEYDSLPRPEALHEALLEAQRFLLDAAVFQRFRQGLLSVSGTWTLRRVGLSEVSFMVVLDTNEVLELTLGLQKTAGQAEETSTSLWSWLAECCLLQLRERHVAPKTAPSDPVEEATPSPAELDPVAAFQLWLQPRLQAAVCYLKQNGTLFLNQPSFSDLPRSSPPPRLGLDFAAHCRVQRVAMEAIRALQQQLMEAQRASNARKISERNCIDLVQKLIQTQQVKLFHTSNGKDYLTPEQLDHATQWQAMASQRREIRDCLEACGGRISVTELPNEMGIGMEHVEARVEVLRKRDSSLHKLNNDLFSQQYLQLLAQEVEESLEESGSLQVADLASRYNLPSEYIRNSVLVLLSSQAVVRQNTVHTSSYAARFEARVRGCLRGCLQPVILSQLATRHGFDPDLLNSTVQKMIREEVILGKFQGGAFTPKAYTDAETKKMDSFFESNGFLTAAMAKTCNLTLKEWVAQRKVEGHILLSAFVSKHVAEEVQAAVAEALAAGAWIDVQPLLPPSLAEPC